MELQSQQRRERGGWSRRERWSSVIQWTLVATLLGQMLISGLSSSWAKNVDLSTIAPLFSEQELTIATRVDARLTAIADDSPERLVRVVMYKETYDDSVEAMVREHGGTVLSELSITNAFVAEISAQAAVLIADEAAVRWVSIHSEGTGSN